MSKIPEDTFTQADFNAWSECAKQLGELKAKEMLLRMRVFKHMFPAPQEGTNKSPLSLGYELHCTYPIGRTIQEDLLAAKVKKLEEAKIKLGDLIVNKPQLVVAEYRKLSEKELKLFDQILVIKPGSPQLKIVLPKRPTAQNVTADD